MKVVRALLLAIVFCLNSSTPAAGPAAPVLQQADVRHGAHHVWALHVDARAGAGRPQVAPISSTLALLGMGLLLLLAVRISRSRH